jgi:hypothetical protein
MRDEMVSGQETTFLCYYSMKRILLRVRVSKTGLA